MTYDFEKTYRKGDKDTFNGFIAVDEGTLTFTGTQKFSILDTSGDVVTGYNNQDVTGQTASAAAELEAWVNLDTDDANLPIGSYTAVMELVATASADGLEREKIIRIRILIVTANGWPSVEEIAARYEETGLTAPGDETLSQMRSAAITGWERKTGYEPFLADAEDTTWLFQPEDLRLLDFGRDGGPGGFISITSVTVGKTYANPTGILLVSGRDYQLKPANATNKSRPYDYLIQNRVEYDAGEASIEIIGKAGFSDSIPADAWEAVLRCVIALLLPSQGIAISGGMEQITELDTTVRYGAAGPVVTAITYFEKYEQSVLNTYRRLRVA